MKEKVILAYSGGLDTTAIIPWLKENFDYEVICVCIDCGQAEELDGLSGRTLLFALALGDVGINTEYIRMLARLRREPGLLTNCTAGVETELLPHIPDALFGHLRAAADHLKEVL